MDPDAGGAGGVFGFWLWRAGGVALDCAVSFLLLIFLEWLWWAITDQKCRFFGYGMVAVGLTFVPVTTMTYVSDCYLPVNADALLLVNGLKVCSAELFNSRFSHGACC